MSTHGADGGSGETHRRRLGRHSLFRHRSVHTWFKLLRGGVALHITLNSVYNDYVYNDIPVIAIEFHGPGHDASI